MNITLRRIAQSEQGTFGVLIKDNIPLCVTVELPWRNNQRKISCIPAGAYDCVPYSSKRYDDVWLLEGVPDRDDILIHAANSINDLQGCIGPGINFSRWGNMPVVSNSQKAMDMLRKELPERFTLNIEDRF